MSMSNNEQGNGIVISVQVSNQAVEKINSTVLEWRKVGSFDLKTVLEAMERIGDKCLGVIQSVEVARASRRPDVVHVHEKTTKV